MALHNVDQHSLGGSLLSIGAGFLGMVTSNTPALWIGAIAGLTTIVYNLIKSYRETLEIKRIQKELEENEE